MRVCEELRAALAGLGLSQNGVHTIYAAGSVGRLEICEDSDVDGVVVLSGPLSEFQSRDLMRAIESCYAEAGLVVAKSGGIYRQPITKAQLLNIDTRGSLTESPGIYGKRIQILLDARPLFGEQSFQGLQQEVLKWFMPKLGRTVPVENFLLTELKRYYAAYSLWQNFKFTKSAEDGWLLRQAKLKITRTSTITGLILLLGARSDSARDFDLMQHLFLTPLERILNVFSRYAETRYCEQYLAAYESAVRLLGNQQVRRRLIEFSPESHADIDDKVPEEFIELCDLAAQLGDITAAFILDRKSDWSREFYRQCLI